MRMRDTGMSSVDNSEDNHTFPLESVHQTKVFILKTCFLQTNSLNSPDMIRTAPASSTRMLKNDLCG